MTNRIYRGGLGLLLLVSLYFDQPIMMYALIVMLFIEGISNILLPNIINTLLDKTGWPIPEAISTDACLMSESLFHFSDERIWRLVVGAMLILTYSNIEVLWFFPWFMGFAIFGAGLSGVCPVLLFIHWVRSK